MKFERTEERRTTLPEAEERLYDILTPSFERDRINIGEFSDLYGSDVIEKDLRKLEDIERHFKSNAEENPDYTYVMKRGELFEAIVADQIEYSNWLGENASFIRTSQYDDYVNKIDGVVEFEHPTSRSHLALAADITESGDNVCRKFEEIRDSIKRGTLSRVKYFKSHGLRGELSMIPRVIIGADKRTMQEVAALILEFRTARSALTRIKAHPDQKEAVRANLAQKVKQSRAALEHHPLQRKLLLEINAQLEAFRTYATTLGQHEAAKRYDDMYRVITAILNAKKSMTREGIPKDDVYDLIIEHAQRLNEKEPASALPPQP